MCHAHPAILCTSTRTERTSITERQQVPQKHMHGHELDSLAVPRMQPSTLLLKDITLSSLPKIS